MDKLRGIVAKVLVTLLFGVLILSFAVWGIGDMLRQGGDEPVVAEVAGQPVQEQTYRRELSETLSILSRRIGSQVDLEMAQALGLPQQVLQRLVTDKLIAGEAEARGLIVTDEQIARAIRNNPNFQGPTGQFDRSRFEQTLFQARLSEAGYVADLREQLLQQQLSTALGAAVTPPTALVEALYKRQAERRQADWVSVSLSALPAPEAPGEAALREYYEANTDAFMAPAYRELSYLWLRPDDLFDEVGVTEQQLRDEYESNPDAYLEPERRTLEQAVYETEAAAEEAYQRVEGGEDYAAVVQETTGDTPAPLGTVTVGALPPALRDAAFGAESAGVVAPVESSFGWHLIRIEAIEEGETAGFEQVRPEIEQAVKRREAVDALVSIVNQLDDELASGASLEEAAGKLDVQVREIAAIDSQGYDPEGEVVTPLPQRERFLTQAFETPVGEQSLVLETEQGGYFLVRVDGERPAAPRAFESVRDEVEQRWRREQRQDAAWDLVDRLQQRLGEGQTLAKLAEDEGLSVTEGEPLQRSTQEPSAALVQALFEVGEGESVTAEGPDGPILAVLRSIEVPDPAEAPDQLATIRQDLTQRLRSDVFDLYLRALEQRLGVQVYPERIDRVLAGF